MLAATHQTLPLSECCSTPPECLNPLAHSCFMMMIFYLSLHLCDQSFFLRSISCLCVLVNLQIADVMDAPCKQVNWNKTPPPPYEPGFGFRCFSVAGQDNSFKTKRDIGVTLNLIITYKNTCAQPPACCAISCHKDAWQVWRKRLGICSE